MNGGELLEALVNVPSVSGKEGPLADLLFELLRDERFNVQREGDNVWFTLGRAGPHLLLLSHIDTVPPCDGWSGDPFRLRRLGKKLTGLGANDAKGCVAAMILAAREQGALEGAVTFAFVAGEERNGAGARVVRSELPRIDAAIVGEPSMLEVCTSQNGMLLLRCIAQGRAAHVAHAKLGENAIEMAARDIARLAGMQSRPQVTQITGGAARNQVPDHCEFFVDLRTKPETDHEVVIAEIDAALESQVNVHSARYIPVASDESEPIVRAALEAARRECGIRSSTTSDWVFLNGIPAVKAGPGNTNRSHQADEYLLEGELDAGAAFYARSITGYFQLMKAHV
ncbi:MAG: M20/M25/M40 family metallo-hydrolase [Verrucomicrobia bacterium]|nr:M20/M25/M40 family metallo-hydrolase [Verrucomicrobiota bacterium]